jgi:D-tyrosyl-tRNA(Tyr) deacylase
MKAVIQRVSSAEITIGDVRTAHIGKGLVILLGIAQGDSPRMAEYLADKIANLRIFEDDAGKMNRSTLEVGGAALVVSNFTLIADAKKGRRPSFVEAARPETAEPLYEHFVSRMRAAGVAEVQTGEFGADMLINIANDGPVTLVLDTDTLL